MRVNGEMDAQHDAVAATQPGPQEQIEEECVLFCFFKPILGNHYGSGVSARGSQGGCTHDPRSPTSLLTMSPLR